MGIFRIQATGMGSVYCSMMESLTNQFQVIPSSIDMAYDERIKMIYAESSMGGKVSGINTGLVTVKFTMLVKGDDQADTITNLRQLTMHVTNDRGGFLRYRPLGLGDSVMETFYRYVQSKVPNIIKNEGLIKTVMDQYIQDGIEHAVLAEVELETYAWGFSNPYSLITIAAEQAIENHYDGSDNNTFTIASSAIKGDVIFPVIEIRGNNVGGGENEVTDLYVHARQLEGSTVYHTDWLQGEDGTPGASWSDQAESGASGGYACEYTDSTGEDELYFTGITDLDWDALGRIAVIMAARVESNGDAVHTKVAYDVGSYRFRNVTQTINVDKYLVATYYLYDFDHINAPMLKVPDRMGEGANPDIDTFTAQSGPVVIADGESSGDKMQVDWIWCPKVDGRNYLAKFMADDDSEGIDDGQTRILVIDAIEGQAYVMNTSDEMVGVWSHHGPPIDQFMIYKRTDGYDTALRFVGADTDSGTDTGWSVSFEFRVTVYGIYGTIFPFEEA